MAYERLLREYSHIKILEVYMPKGLGGLYMDNIIYIDKYRSLYEKHCLLAEEIGHYETTIGDITELADVRERKLEQAARRWGYEKIVSLDKLIECYKLNYTSLEEVCTFLEVTAEYLKTSIDHYSSSLGISTIHRGYQISFDPLYIREA